MRTYTNALPAPYGLYVSTHPVDIAFVSADGEAVEGKEGARYRRIPTLLAVLLSPLAGGAFVLAFPLIVLVAVVWGFAQLALRAARRHSVGESTL